ncbi:hypothetical protein FRC00_009921 [Tulasnella sp. 408]|nr:hypothetical protein FRC00_009921 [Tulasnella sp. 408]
MVRNTSKRSLPDLRETPGAGPSTSTNSAPPTTTSAQVFVHPDGEPVHFFLQPDLDQALLNNFENAITARGGHRVVSSPPERGGFIVVDPRTPQGAKFVRGDQKELKWRVVSYTFLRACIFKGEVLKPDDFKNVKPVFEREMAALKMHMHSSLMTVMSAQELDDLKFLISKHGGHSGATKSKANVIIASDDKLKDLRRQYDHSAVHVESVGWVKSAVKKGSFRFTEGLSPEEIQVLQAKPPHAPVARYDFTDPEEDGLVKFLAEFYPAKSDLGRAQHRGYEYLLNNVSPKLYVSSTTLSNPPPQLDIYPWARKHPLTSWHHHYVRERKRLDEAIDRYIAAHPELQRTEEEAAEHRDEVFGPARRRPGPPKGRKKQLDSDDEDDRPKKRRKKRTSQNKKDQTDPEEDVDMPVSADVSPRPERKSKTEAKRSITEVVEAEVAFATNEQGVRPDDEEEVDQLEDDVVDEPGIEPVEEPGEDVEEPGEDVEEPDEDEVQSQLVDDISHGSIVPDSAEPSQDERPGVQNFDRDLLDAEIDFPETTDSFPPIRIAPPPEDEDEDEDELDSEVAIEVKAPAKKGKGKAESGSKDVFARAVRRPAGSRTRSSKK